MSDQVPSDPSENGVALCVFAGSFFLSIIKYQHSHCCRSVLLFYVVWLSDYYFFTHIVQGLGNLKTSEIKVLGLNHL